jgi:iron uptake system component EfeO
MRTTVRLGITVLIGTALLLTGCQGTPHTPAAPTVAPEREFETPSSSVRGPVDPRVTASVRSYQAYVRAQAAALPARARAFTDAVRAGDLTAARKDFAASRAGWERIQSVALLLPQLDRRIDARADDFASATDPAWTGWHRLERILWTQRSTAGAVPLADRLDRDLESVRRTVPTLSITPKRMAAGIERQMEEAIAEKLPGAEDRYSRTDLADLAGNIQGAQAGYAAARPLLLSRDPARARLLDRQFATVERTLGKYRTAAGYRPYPALSTTDRAALQAQLTSLAETLSALSAILTR